ncbi:YitT family protein [Merdimmobilis hominis]|jgi:uncharacterized membrane-anchored protein YitT (DUF2179 family)|uniref:DUF2179 domain-containing protein n=1 Tax=uncultured Anaerotruncus sp. TaxID=905011 RepID=A0A6N2UHS1_9FIRM|nr:YitT family protein [Merdimmobilis hominis]MCD4835326.1 YitT family protein [Merdimmobilis hominis]
MSQQNSSKFREFLLLNLGILPVIIGVYFFKFPNNFSIGGVSGLSVVVAPFLPGISPGSLVFGINMALLVVGYLMLGKGFGIKTAYTSTVLSAGVWVLERIFPMDGPMTDEPLLELIFAVMLPAIGSAILFRIDASTGGTDIVAMIVRKYTHMDIGQCLLASDILITLAAFFVFGPKTGLLSILGLSAKSIAVDAIMENMNRNKYFTIITTEPQAICDYIVGELHRGATIYKGEGYYTHEDRTIVLTALYRRQASQLQKYAREVDPKAFILITNSSEIVGKGFRGSI